jgi:hypothetical protein
MEGILGSSLGVFIGLTLIVFGGGAFLTGQTLAEGWKPQWMVYSYGLLLGLGDRFLVFALFGGELLSLSGFIVNTAVLIVIALIAYRMNLARRMVKQYPWLYERSGPFGWREIGGTSERSVGV